MVHAPTWQSWSSAAKKKYKTRTEHKNVGDGELSIGVEHAVCKECGRETDVEQLGKQKIHCDVRVTCACGFSGEFESKKHASWTFRVSKTANYELNVFRLKAVHAQVISDLVYIGKRLAEVTTKKRAELGISVVDENAILVKDEDVVRWSEEMTAERITWTRDAISAAWRVFTRLRDVDPLFVSGLFPTENFPSHGFWKKTRSYDRLIENVKLSNIFAPGTTLVLHDEERFIEIPFDAVDEHTRFFSYTGGEVKFKIADSLIPKKAR